MTTKRVPGEIDLDVVELIYETHATTVDNERGIATGWLPGELSPAGCEQARELGDRRRGTVDVVFSSDLRRAVQTVEVADLGLPHLADWRLRECDYGEENGMPAARLHRSRAAHLDRPYPGGESWRQAVHRVGRFLDDLPLRWSGRRVLVIGHVATRWAFDHLIGGTPLEELVEADFGWREGWEYRLP